MHLFRKFHENLPVIFRLILRTDRQTDTSGNITATAYPWRQFAARPTIFQKAWRSDKASKNQPNNFTRKRNTPTHRAGVVLGDGGRVEWILRYGNHNAASWVITTCHQQLQNCLHTSYNMGWFGSRVVSVLDSGTVGPGFKSQSRRCRVTVLGKLFTPIVPLFTKQRNW